MKRNKKKISEREVKFT